jgi:hypothetical protein
MNSETERLATFYLELAKTAQSRFDSRRDIEWKVTVALWTLFGAATAAVITSRVWSAPLLLVVFLTMGVFVVVLLYGLWWLPYLAKSFRRDQRTSYYWESGVQLLTGTKLPLNLDPGYEIKNGSPIKLKDWIRMEDCPIPNSICGGEVSATLHNSQRSQFYLTLAFAFLFIIVIWGKWLVGPSTPTLQQSSSHSETADQ